MKILGNAWRGLLVGLTFLPLFLMFQNFTSDEGHGAISYWLLDSNGFSSSGNFAHPGIAFDMAPWNLVASADLNHDGKADLVWQNKADGSLAVWFMDGVQFKGSANIAKANPYMGLRDWRVVTVADMNHDGSPDIVWQNRRDGSVVYWYMNGLDLIDSEPLPDAMPEANLKAWILVGAYDLNGDGEPDLLWQNRQNGTVGYWYMHGAAVLNSQTISAVDPNFNPLRWELKAALDLNGDGKPDFLWQNVVDGSVAYWVMDGVNYKSTALINGDDAASLKLRSVVAVADLNGDGRADLVWQKR